MKTIKFKLYYLNQALGYEWCDKTGWHHSVIELKDQVFDGVLPNDRVNGEVIRVQFTGLHDLYNNEIYNGDIVRGQLIDKIENYLVYFSSMGSFDIHNIEHSVDNFCLCDLIGNYQLLGNKYENPELLK